MAATPPNLAFGFAQWKTLERPPESGIVRGRAGFNTTLGRLEYWDGKFWESISPFTIPNLVDDGVTDNADIIQEAASLVGEIIAFPPGTYICGSTVTWPTTARVIGLGDVTIQGTGTGSLWKFESSVHIEGINFAADVYSSPSDTIATVTLLRVENTGSQVEDIYIGKCSFSGAQNAINVTEGLRATIRDVDIYRSRDYGLTIQTGCQQVIIDGVRIREVGNFEGIKLGAGGQLVPYEDILISNFYIEGCGQGGGQEGIDMFAKAAQRIKISNGIIKDCYNGGIEIKKTATSALSPDTYVDIQIDNVFVENDTDAGSGVTMEYVDGPAGSPDLAGRVRVSNMVVRYTGGGTAANMVGATITAYTDVEITNNSYDYLAKAVVLTGAGSSDDTVRRPFIAYNKATNCNTGINFATGTLESAVIRNNYFSITGSGNAIYLESGTGEIINNHLAHSSTDAIRIDGGTWTIMNNDISVLTTKRGWVFNNAPTISAANNILGFATVTPTVAGALGDVFFNSAPAALGAEKWICTVAGNSGAATWKAVLIAA